MPKLNSLRELFEIMLRDVYDAEKQIAHAMPKMIKVVTNYDLQTILEAHLKETQEQMARLERVFQLLDLKPKAKRCSGMEGILKEAVDLAGMSGEGAVVDAACVAAVQMIEHYEITAYGTLAEWCKLLHDHSEALWLLTESEREEKTADSKLSELARTQINSEAMMAATVQAPAK